MVRKSSQLNLYFKIDNTFEKLYFKVIDPLNALLNIYVSYSGF